VETDHRRTTARTSRNTIKKTSPKRRVRLPRCPLLRGKSSRGLLNHSQMRESGRKPSSYGPCFPEPLQPRLLEAASSRKTRNSRKPNQMDEEGPKHNKVNKVIPRVTGPRVQLASTKTRSKKWKRKTNPTHLERSSGQSLAHRRRSQTIKLTSNPRLGVTYSRVERNQESRQCGHLSQKRAKVGRIAEVANEVDSKIARKDRA